MCDAAVTKLRFDRVQFISKVQYLQIITLVAKEYRVGYCTV